MNQLTDIRNKSAENKKIFSDYVVHIGAFLYYRHVHCGDGEPEKALVY